MKEAVKLMYQAVNKDDIEQAKHLINEFPDLITTFIMDESFLHTAALKNAYHVAKLLIESGLDVDVLHKDRPETALHVASSHNALETAKVLIENGANVEGYLSSTPLHKAIISSKNTEMVKFLVEHGADTNALFTNFDIPLTPIKLASWCGLGEIVNYLKSVGCSLPNDNELPANKDDISEHIRKNLAAPEKLELRQIIGDLSIMVATSGKCSAIITRGLSNSPMNVPKGKEVFQYAELLMYLPEDWPIVAGASHKDNELWPAEWLLKIADYPKSNNTWLGPESTVIDNGEIIHPSVNFTGFLLILTPGDLGELHTEDGKVINFYTVFPLYPKEIEYEKRHGIEALIQKFFEKRIGLEMSPKRPCAV